MSRSIAIVALGIALGACGGRSEKTEQSDETARDSPGSGRNSNPRPAAGSAGSGSARVEVKQQPPSPSSDPARPLDANKQIAELGAIPAWQAVVDRAQFLARRDQKGVIYGRIGPVVPPAPAPAASPADAGIPSDAGASDAGAPDAGAIDAGAPDAGTPPSPYVWIVDDTEGNGALGIRVALGRHTANTGDRVAIAGAWELDTDRRWFWKVSALQQLAPSTEPPTGKDLPWPAPSHVPISAPFPPGVKPIKQAKDNDLVYFQLVGPTPAGDGDGWLVGAELYGAPIALMIFPGERPSYGAQDMRARDERWVLKTKTHYWVRIGKIRAQGPGKPFTVQARTAPVRAI